MGQVGHLPYYVLVAHAENDVCFYLIYNSELASPVMQCTSRLILHTE